MKKFIATILAALGLVTTVNAQELGGFEIGTADLVHVETGEIMQVIILNGDFTPGITASLDAVIKDNPDHKKIIMNSGGGVAYEGWQMSALLSETDMAVWIPRGRICLSACANAFMGGKDYEISGQLGFHNAWISTDNWIEIVNEGPNTLNNVHAAAQNYGAYTAYHFLANGFSIDFVFDVINNSNESTFVMFDNEADFMRYYVRDDKISENNVLTNYLQEEAEPVTRNGDKLFELQYEQYQDLMNNGGNWEATNIEVQISTLPIMETQNEAQR